MPNCPQCLKHFPTERGVAAHLAQKTTKCNLWERGPVALPQTVGDGAEEHSSSEHGSSKSCSPSLRRSLDLPPVPNDDDFDMDFLPNDPDAMDLLEEDRPDGEQADSQPSVAAASNYMTSLGLGHQVRYFPGASKVHDVGQTFLDRFGMDTYAVHRRSNVYYPFSSHDDWQVANYLLQSHLSMAKIDEHLKLNFVRFSVSIFSVAHSIISASGRYGPFPFHFRLRRNCEVALSSFHLDRVGITESYLRRIPPRIPPYCTTAMLSSASNHCSTTRTMHHTWTIPHSDFFLRQR